MSNTKAQVDKLDLLRETCTESDEFNLMLDKMLEVTIHHYSARIKRYDQELGEYEQQYGMDTEEFYRRFESGDLGDSMDYFEWAGLFELRLDIGNKLRRLESAS